MESRAETAKEKFGRMSCAAAVLTTYTEETGLSEFEAKMKAMPMAGGRMGKCGAVLAAQEVLKVKAPEKLEQLEKLFAEKNGSVMCDELKGRTGGPMLRSCPGCVEDACIILEQLIG